MPSCGSDERTCLIDKLASMITAFHLFDLGLFILEMLGKGIKYYRHQKAITQKELAEMCQISNNAMCQIENDNVMISIKTLASICIKLEVTKEQLLYKSIPDNILKRLIYDESKQIGKGISSMAKMSPENRVKFIEELENLSEKYK